jgi:hypothetical protein
MFSVSDKGRLRELAKKCADISHSPENMEKIAAWKAHITKKIQKTP